MKQFLIKYRYLHLVALMAVLAVGCNPEDNDHLKIPEFVSGGTVWAKVVPEQSFFNVNDLANSRYALDLSAYDFEDGTLIASYDIYVSFVDASEDSVYDEVSLRKVTEFPSRIEISPDEIADAIGLPNGRDDFGAGDFFDFRMEVIMKDGRVFTAENTTDDIVLEERARGTFALQTFVGCPTFNRDDLIGAYTVTKDEFEVTMDATTEVIAGPEDNQITIKDAFGHGLDMIVTFDESGAATVAKQYTWVPQNFGLPASYGKGYSAGGGMGFSCVGTITLDFTYSVDIGTFGGTWNYTIVKQ
jgi:hypothetical protein